MATPITWTNVAGPKSDSAGMAAASHTLGNALNPIADLAKEGRATNIARAKGMTEKATGDMMKAVLGAGSEEEIQGLMSNIPEGADLDMKSVLEGARVRSQDIAAGVTRGLQNEGLTLRNQETQFDVNNQQSIHDLDARGKTAQAEVNEFKADNQQEQYNLQTRFDKAKASTAEFADTNKEEVYADDRMNADNIIKNRNAGTSIAQQRAAQSATHQNAQLAQARQRDRTNANYKRKAQSTADKALEVKSLQALNEGKSRSNINGNPKAMQKHIEMYGTTANMATLLKTKKNNGSTSKMSVGFKDFAKALEAEYDGDTGDITRLKSDIATMVSKDYTEDQMREVLAEGQDHDFFTSNDYDSQFKIGAGGGSKKGGKKSLQDLQKEYEALKNQ